MSQKLVLQNDLAGLLKVVDRSIWPEIMQSNPILYFLEKYNTLGLPFNSSI